MDSRKRCWYGGLSTSCCQDKSKPSQAGDGSMQRGAWRLAVTVWWLARGSYGTTTTCPVGTAPPLVYACPSCATPTYAWTPRTDHNGAHQTACLASPAKHSRHACTHSCTWMVHPHCEFTLVNVAGWFMWYYTNNNPPVSCGSATWPTGSTPQANASSGTYGACSPQPFQK